MTGEGAPDLAPLLPRDPTDPVPPLPPQPVIRTLRPDDADFLARYAAACDRVTDAAGIARIAGRWRETIGKPGHLGVVVWLNGRRVGFQDAWIKGETLKLNEIYVEASCRGQGLGKMMLTAIMKQGAARGLKKVRFDTELDNWPMRRLAEAAGFEGDGKLFERKL